MYLWVVAMTCERERERGREREKERKREKDAFDVSMMYVLMAHDNTKYTTQQRQKVTDMFENVCIQYL
jgi:hypothetical protein